MVVVEAVWSKRENGDNCQEMTVPPASSPGTAGCGDEDGARLQHHLLERRCDQLQNDNRRLLHRIYQVRKLTKRYKKEIKFLSTRLDMHGDNFRNVKDEEIEPHPQVSDQKSGPIKSEKSFSNRSGASDKSGAKRSAPKRKHIKTEKVDTLKKTADSFLSGDQGRGPPVAVERISDFNRRQDRSKQAWKANENRKMFY